MNTFTFLFIASVFFYATALFEVSEHRRKEAYEKIRGEILQEIQKEAHRGRKFEAYTLKYIAHLEELL